MGFSIIGGIDGNNFIDDSCFYVSRIVEGGAAHAEGRLGVGDKLISIKTKRFDRSFNNITHAEAVVLLSDTKDEVTLKVIKFQNVNFDKISFKNGRKSLSRSREDTLVSTKRLVQKPIPGGRFLLLRLIKFLIVIF